MSQPNTSQPNTSYSRTHQANTSSPSSTLNIEPLAGHAGAIIHDLQLSASLEEPLLEQLQAALVQYKVLFFRHQQQLDDEQQQAFGDRFGKVIAHPTVPPVNGTRLFELDASGGGGRANSWHTDVTFIEAFPKISILRSIRVPEYGGDTVWANTETAYDSLPDELKQLAETLRAVHSNDYDYGADREVTDKSRLDHHRKVFVSSVWEAEHPLVHVHPVSGRRALLLGHFFKRFVGLNGRDSARLFEVFQSRITALENTVRWRWQAGDVAIWDNRSTQHYAINDYGDQPRLMRRVTVEGDTAVAVDGSRSRTVSRPDTSQDEIAA